MINNIKELFPNYVLFVKVGNFFECYNEDSHIMSYLFRYKLKTINGNTSCGFPIVSINKVKTLLENRSVNYLLVDKKHNYQRHEKMNYKKKNNYKELLTKANEYVDRNDRIDKICKFLNNNPDKIELVEKTIYER